MPRTIQVDEGTAGGRQLAPRKPSAARRHHSGLAILGFELHVERNGLPQRGICRRRPHDTARPRTQRPPHDKHLGKLWPDDQALQGARREGVALRHRDVAAERTPHVAATPRLHERSACLRRIQPGGSRHLLEVPHPPPQERRGRLVDGLDRPRPIRRERRAIRPPRRPVALPGHRLARHLPFTAQCLPAGYG